MTEYSFEHCAVTYEASRQREHCPAQALIHRLMSLGVNLDRVCDIGSGSGYWLVAMQQAGVASGANLALDLSPTMLSISEKRVKNTRHIVGGIGALGSLEINADCIFMCMTAHLLNFPEDLRKIVSFAQARNIPSIVILEEVSVLYQAMVGNAHYMEHLPASIQKALLAYKNLRDGLNKDELVQDRDAPFPTPGMSLQAWGKLGIDLEICHHETPGNIGWLWNLSAEDIVTEIRERNISTYFCHNEAEAKIIAHEIEGIFASELPMYRHKHSIPFWFSLSILKPQI
jgi:SAM-dependent methyltransferase